MHDELIIKLFCHTIRLTRYQQKHIYIMTMKLGYKPVSMSEVGAQSCDMHTDNNNTHSNNNEFFFLSHCVFSYDPFPSY